MLTHNLFIKSFKPTSAGIRHQKRIKHNLTVHAVKALKTQTQGCFAHGGRNNTGRITCYTKSTRAKRSVRILERMPCLRGIVEYIEYTPMQNTYLARIYNFLTKKHFYTLAAKFAKRGDVITPKGALNQVVFLKNIRIGAVAFNFANMYCRASGTFGIVLQKTRKYVLIRFSSGIKKIFHPQTISVLGISANGSLRNTVLGKAGRSRQLGCKPSVRGVAMNPIDHPHGGGSSKTTAGQHPVTPWGCLTKGVKTRKKTYLFYKKYITC